MFTKTGLAFVGFLLFVMITIGLLFSPVSPLFRLDDNSSIYQITKLGQNYYIVKIDRWTAPKPNAPFKGDAIKISGADFNLDEFLDQNVMVEGIFSTHGGIHNYYLTTIKR